MTFSIFPIQRSGLQQNIPDDSFAVLSQNLSQSAQESLDLLRRACTDHSQQSVLLQILSSVILSDLPDVIAYSHRVLQNVPSASLCEVVGKIAEIKAPLRALFFNHGLRIAGNAVELSQLFEIRELFPLFFNRDKCVVEESGIRTIIKSLYHLVKYATEADLNLLHEELSNLRRPQRVQICIQGERFFKELTSIPSCLNTLKVLKMCHFSNLSELSDQTFALLFNGLDMDSALRLIDRILDKMYVKERIFLLEKVSLFFALPRNHQGKEALAAMLDVPFSRWAPAIRATEAIVPPSDTVFNRIAIFNTFGKRSGDNYDVVVADFKQAVSSHEISGERCGFILNAFLLFRHSPFLFDYFLTIENPEVGIGILEVLTVRPQHIRIKPFFEWEWDDQEDKLSMISYLKTVFEGVINPCQRQLICRALEVFGSDSLCRIMSKKKSFPNQNSNVIARALAYRVLATFNLNEGEEKWLPFLEEFFDRFVERSGITVEKALKAIDRMNNLYYGHGKWLFLCEEIKRRGIESVVDKFPEHLQGSNHVDILIAYMLFHLEHNHPDPILIDKVGNFLKPFDTTLSIHSLFAFLYAVSTHEGDPSDILAALQSLLLTSENANALEGRFAYLSCMPLTHWLDFFKIHPEQNLSWDNFVYHIITTPGLRKLVFEHLAGVYQEPYDTLASRAAELTVCLCDTLGFSLDYPARKEALEYINKSPSKRLSSSLLVPPPSQRRRVSSTD